MGAPVVDPAVSLVLRGALVWVFAVAALHKLRDPAAYGAIVRGYRLLPDAGATAWALGLGLAEAATVAALLVPGLVAYGAAGAGLLLGLYSTAIGINLARGRRDVDCGCAGPGRRQTLSGWLLVRNGALLAAAAACAAPVGARPVHWLDAVTAVGGVCALVLLFTAVAGLGAPRAPARPGALG